MSVKRRSMWSIHLYFDVATLILAAITWFTFTQVDAWHDVSGELLSNPDFEAGLLGWRASRQVRRGQAGTVDLSGQSVSESHVIDQILQRPASGYVRLTADVRMEHVRQGPKFWQTARVDVLGLNPASHWDFIHKLLSETGTHDAIAASRIFYIAPRYREIKVSAALTGGTGTFVVNRMSAREVTLKPAVVTVKRIILGGWVVLIAVVLGALVQRRAWRLFIALVPGGAFLLFIPHNLLLWTAALTTFKGLHLALDHLALFLAMTIAAIWGYRGHRIWPILHLAVLGVAVEAVQFYLPGRLSEFVDILSDLLGIALGVLVVEIGVRLNRSRQTFEQSRL